MVLEESVELKGAGPREVGRYIGHDGKAPWPVSSGMTFG
jgi:hypothetical protein